MKKIFTIALCGLAVLCAGAQKATVDQAKKLAGKTDKINEARALIQEAIQNPETANQALTYYTAGKIEWDAYDKQKAVQMASPDNVNPLDMSNELLQGLDYFVAVFPLDLVPNEKGEVKPKYVKELQKKIAEKHTDFFDAGAVFYGEKMWPQAFVAFMNYGDLPDMDLLGNHKPQVPDTTRALAYYYAGLSAWSGNQLDNAAYAFAKAREHNYTQPDAYIYEIATWQNIEQNDTTREKEAMNAIFDASKAGYEKFGMEQPIFLNNMVNSMLNSGRENESLQLANDAIGRYPDYAALYGLRAFVYDRMGNSDASEADYRKAASMPNVDYETMLNAVKKIFRTGQEKWNEIELNDADIVAKKKAVHTNYFEEAKKMAEKARTLTDDTSAIDYLIESIDYQLSL